jgi:hypothetical protein
VGQPQHSLSHSHAKAGPEPHLFHLDLSTSFHVEHFLANGTFDSLPLPPTLPPNPATITESNSAALWSSNDTLYAAEVDSSITSFDTVANQWRSVDVSGAHIDFQNYSPETSVSIPYSGLSFFFGETNVSGLVRFDASKPDALEWTNQMTQSNTEGVRVPKVA